MCYAFYYFYVERNEKKTLWQQIKFISISILDAMNDFFFFFIWNSLQSKHILGIASELFFVHVVLDNPKPHVQRVMTF